MRAVIIKQHCCKYLCRQLCERACLGVASTANLLSSQPSSASACLSASMTPPACTLPSKGGSPPCATLCQRRILLRSSPGTQEPTKHQYDWDAATTMNFLRTYGLEGEFKLNIECNHATLAGHSCDHELQVRGVRRGACLRLARQ